MSLSGAILVQLLEKRFDVPQRDILGAQVAYVVKQALKQVAHDYNLEYQALKDKYFTDCDTECITAPSPPKAVKKKAAPKSKPKAPEVEADQPPAQIQVSGARGAARPEAASKPALSKMKKDELVKECEEFGVSSEGTVPQLRERLKGARAGTLAPEAPPAPKKKAVKKKKGSDKKEKPVHTHTLQEEPVDGCGVCDTYGNIAGDQGDDDFEEEAEAGLSIKERLKRLLATHGAAEEEPNDEDDPEYDPDREDGEL